MWNQANFTDQLANEIAGLRPRVVCVEGVCQIGHLLTVDVAQAGMEPQWFILFLLKCGLQDGLAFLQGPHLVVHAGVVHAVADGVDHIVQRLLHLGQFAGLQGFGLYLRRPHFVIGLLVFGDELRDEFGREQAVLETCQHAIFDQFPLNCQLVVARALVAGVGAAVFGLVDKNHATAAAGAFEQSREQVLVSARPGQAAALVHGIACGRLTVFHLLPKVVINDPQMGHLFDHPILFGVHAGLTLAGERVFDKALPVPDQAAHVKFVVEDTCATLPIAVDRGWPPGCPARPADALCVQITRDIAGAFAVCVFAEDAPNHVRLFLHDGPVALGEGPVGQKLTLDLIAKGQPTSGLALFHAPLKAPVRFDGEVFEEERRHGAFEAHVQLRNLALGDREDRDAGKGHLFVEGGDMLLIPAETVEPFGDHNIELAHPRVFHQPLIPLAQMGRAALAIIGIDRPGLPSVSVDEFFADADLVLDRRFRLHIRRVTCVDGGFHDVGLSV